MRFIRRRRDSWLHVDDQVATSGYSAGILTSLNTEIDLLLGGVDDDVIAFHSNGANFNDGFHGTHKITMGVQIQIVNLVLSVVLSGSAITPLVNGVIANLDTMSNSSKVTHLSFKYNVKVYI